MTTTRRPIIALMTDFGTQDWYVAAMKGVLLTYCPHACLLDITHDIPAQDVMTAALTLAWSTPWLPSGTVVTAVVDPGVGTARRLLAARADGRYFVGPDNGLFTLVFRRARQLSLVHLTRAERGLPAVSQTFHGRDLIAPIAARLARGERLASMGRRTSTYTQLRVPDPVPRRDVWHGSILTADRFGNLITNLHGALVRKGSRIRFQRRWVPVVSSYEEGRNRGVIAIVGSTGHIELAVFGASVAQRCRAGRGDAVELRTA